MLATATAAANARTLRTRLDAVKKGQTNHERVNGARYTASSSRHYVTWRAAAFVVVVIVTRTLLWLCFLSLHVYLQRNAATSEMMFGTFGHSQSGCLSPESFA